MVKSDLPRNPGSKHLTLSAIKRIAFAVRDGKAIPREAKQLMVEFCRYDGHDQAVPAPEFRRLIHHFAECFLEYLKGGSRIERALGLRRKIGQPEADEAVRQDMATAVLRLRLAGESHQNAVAETVEKYGWEKTVIGEAFRDHFPNALVVISEERRKDQERPRTRRPADQYPWSPRERVILRNLQNARKRRAKAK